METSFNNPSGWVRLHRSLFNSYVGADPVRFYRYCDLLAMAAYDDSATVWTGTRQLRLSAGQFVASKSYLARRWGISPTPAYKFMAALESHGLLTHKVVDGICVYTIIEVDKTIDDKVDQTVAQRVDRHIDYSKDCDSSNNASSNFVRETTVDTNCKTGIESGRETQYKEVRNKKEEKENIYRERVRAERESLNNFIVSFFASQSDDLRLRSLNIRVAGAAYGRGNFAS